MAKKCLPLLLAALLLLTACAGGESVPASAGEGQTAQEETMEVLYTENCYPLPGGYLLQDIARVGDRLLILGTGDGGCVLGLAGYVLEDNGRVSVSDARLLTAGLPGEDGACLRALTAGEDGYFYVLADDSGAEGGGLSILRFTAGGEPEGSMELGGCPGDEYIRGIDALDGGRLVLHGDRTVLLVQWPGAEALASACVGEGELIDSASPTAGGVVFSTLSGDRYLLDRETGELERLDRGGGKMPMSFAGCQGLAGEYIINNGAAFYQYDLGEGTGRELLCWNYADSSFDALGPGCRLGESAFACVFTDSGALTLCGMERVHYAERSVVKVALVGVSELVLAEANSTSRLYEYQGVSYPEEETGRLLTGMMAEDPPDLVLFRSGVNTDTGAFEDLYPYLDEDPELSRDSFLPNFLEALSAGGELHQLWDQVSICTLDARVSDVGDGRGLTPADYNRIAEERGEYKAVFNTFMSRSNLLSWVARVGVSTCLDRAGGTCSFDSREFTELLAWCGTMGSGIEDGGGVSYDISETVLFFETIQNLRRVNVLPGLFGEPLVCVGFPDGGDGYSYYSLENAYSGIAMAIPAGSGNKDGAWAYIRSRLSLDRQLNLGDSADLPVNREALGRLAETMLSGEARTLLDELLSRTKYAQVFSDQALLDIIISCGESYLSGSKSLEEAVALLQSRASLYVGEQFG